MINPSFRPLKSVTEDEVLVKYQEFVLVDTNLDFLDYLALEFENRGKSVKIIDQLDKLYRYVADSKAAGHELIEFRFF